jgi:secretion/DNA translocation related CpaE-like protein
MNATIADQRGLIMVSDPELLDTVLRIAAAAGCEVDRVVDPAAARRRWSDAPLVILDQAAAQRCTDASLPRRDGVLIAVLGPPSPETWQLAVEIGARNVIELPEAEPWLVAVLAEAAEGSHGQGSVLAVVGGRGGAGASVFATALAVTAVRDGADAMLVDCDPLGGGLDIVLGGENQAGMRWSDIGLGGGRVPASALHAALPSPPVKHLGGRGLSVLSCDRSASGPTPPALASIIDAGRRAGEIVVCDLPRYPTEAAVTAVTSADVTLLVVPADLRSATAAARVAAVLTEHGAAIGLVVRGPAPGGVEAAELAEKLGFPLLAAMPPEPGLVGDLESGIAPGRPRGALAKAARSVLDETASMVAVRTAARS